MIRIAVIGAGIAGLAAARELAKRHDVTVFEKSRGVAGRMATRYAGNLEFDHGAQFFTAKSPDFRAFLQPLIEQGVVAGWPACFAELDRDRIVTTRQWDDEYPHYVGVPRMNSIAKALAANLDVRFRTAVTRLERLGSRWALFGDERLSLGEYDWVVLAIPAPQAAALLPESSSIRAPAATAPMRGCYALMLAFDRPLELPWQAALVRRADISWVSVNSSKPGRADAVCIVAHSTNAWADAHIDDDEESVKRHLLDEYADVLGEAFETPSFRSLHRWRYANIAQQTGDDCGIDAELKLAACGDWYVHGRVEAAFTSGHALVGALAGRL